MKLVKFKLDDGTEIEIPEAAEKQLEDERKATEKLVVAAKKKVDDAAAAKKKADDDAAAKKKKADANEPTMSEVQAKLDVLEEDNKALLASQNTRIDERVKLVRTADAILNEKDKPYPTDGISDAQIMRDVILKVRPTLKDKLEANKDDAGYLRASFDAALELHINRAKNVDDTNHAIFGSIVQNSDGNEIDECLTIVDDFYEKRADPAAFEKKQAAAAAGGE